MKRTIMSLVLTVFLFAVVLGTSLANAAEFKVYVVVHGGIGDPYWKKIEVGIKDAAALFPDLKVIYTGPDVYNFEQFMAMLQGAIAAKPDGLLATMTNPEAMDETLRPPIAKGLPVIAIDSPDSRPQLQRIPYLAYIGEVPYQGGVLAAKEVLKEYKPKRAMYGNHHPGAMNIVERGQGFLDVMKEAGVPAEALDITEDPVQGAEIMLGYLKAHPETDTIFTGNMLQAEALVVRLDEEGLKPGKNLKISTFGLTDTTLKMMEEGKIVFSIDEQPYMQGFLGITYMYLHLKYGFNPPVDNPTLGLFPRDVSKLKETVAKGIR
jgi:simple sugar transport system substrate-binding protein